MRTSIGIDLAGWGGCVIKKISVNNDRYSLERQAVAGCLWRTAAPFCNGLIGFVLAHKSTFDRHLPDIGA
jgi:hypothetical protein